MLNCLFILITFWEFQVQLKLCLNSEKKLFEFIQNQEDMFKTTKEDSGQDLTEKKHPIEEEKEPV